MDSQLTDWSSYPSRVGGITLSGSVEATTVSSLNEELEIPYPPLQDESEDQPCVNLSEVNSTGDMQATFDTTAGAMIQLMRGIVRDTRMTGVTTAASADVQITEPQQLGPRDPTCQPVHGDGGIQMPFGRSQTNIGMIMRNPCMTSSFCEAKSSARQPRYMGKRRKSTSTMSLCTRRMRDDGKHETLPVKQF